MSTEIIIVSIIALTTLGLAFFMIAAVMLMVYLVPTNKTAKAGIEAVRETVKEAFKTIRRK